MFVSLDSFVSGLFRAEPQTILSGAVAFGAVVIYRHFRDTPSVLLLVGATAQFIIFAGGVLSQYAATHDWVALDSFPFSCWLLLHAFSAVASICFPIGFLWLALNIRRTSNHAMQRTPTRLSPDISHD